MKKQDKAAPKKIYQEIAAYLMEQIESGKLKLGDAIYSEHTLCRLFNASRTSVRRAIREMVENNILVSRHGSGTFVKGKVPPKSIALLNHYNRGLVANSLDTYFRDIVFDVEAEITRRNCRCLIYSGIIENASEITARTSHLNADGIILDGDYQSYFDDINAFAEIFGACTILDGNPDETDLPSVAPDLTPAFVELLTTIRNTRGDDRILFLHRETLARRRWTKTCFDAAVRQLEMADRVDSVAIDRDIVEPSLLALNPGVLLTPLLEHHLMERNCRVILCSSDRNAMHVIQLLRSRNYCVPDDVAISGIYGIQLSEMTEPPMTTIRIPTRLMAAAAVRLTLDQIRGKAVPQRVLLPTAVFYRESLPKR